jgi:hypothetical protein
LLLFMFDSNHGNQVVLFIQSLNHLVDLDETLYGGDDIEDDLYSILLNRVALTT